MIEVRYITNFRHSLVLTVMLFSAVLFCSGCMLGPDYSRGVTAADDSDEFNYTPTTWAEVGGAATVGQWWERFGDETTVELVRIALENNNDLKVAAGRVLESRAFLEQAHGLRLPSVSYSGGRVRAKPTNVLPVGTTYSQGISISYIVDLFGKLKRAEQAAYRDFQATEYARDALTHAIIAQVVSSRARIATLQGLLDIAEGTSKSRAGTLQIVERRYRAGLVSSVELHLARENLAASESSEPLFRESIVLARNSLDVLVGRRPGSSGDIPKTLPDLPDLSAIPVGLPVDLLDQRPDVRQAELQLAAATDRIGIRIAEMLPDFTLTASGGYRSDNFRLLTATENQVYSAAIALAAPLFTGGRLKAGVDAAKARTEQAAASYASVVLNALREVEDALVSEQYLQERLARLEYRFDEAQKAETLSRDRYSRGVGSLLLVLESERRRRISENELLATKGDLWQRRIGLFLALGGDWQLPESSEKTVTNNNPEQNQASSNDNDRS